MVIIYTVDSYWVGYWDRYWVRYWDRYWDRYWVQVGQWIHCRIYWSQATQTILDP